MRSCCCTLAGTAACTTCPNGARPFAANFVGFRETLIIAPTRVITTVESDPMTLVTEVGSL